MTSSTKQRIPKLVAVAYHIPAPFPPSFVEALRRLPDFHSLTMTLGAVESFPNLLPLVPRLKGLNIKALRHGIAPPIWNAFAPITVAPSRRLRLPLDLNNLATVDEHSRAWDLGLAKLLLAAKDSLVWHALRLKLHPSSEDTLQEKQYLHRLAPFGTELLADVSSPRARRPQRSHERGALPSDPGDVP